MRTHPQSPAPTAATGPTSTAGPTGAVAGAPTAGTGAAAGGTMSPVHPWPRLVFWETTAACNLVCSHCRRTEIADGAAPDQLTTEEAIRLIDEVSAWGRTILVFSGGEPLLRPDIFPLLEHAREKGLMVALATNGTLIDQTVAGRIRKAGVDRVSISFDGADEATHDAFRRMPGSFREALAGAREVRAQGVALQLNVTVARHNVAQLDRMVDLAKELGAAALHFFLLVPVGCGMDIAEEQTLRAEAYEQTLAWLYEVERRETALQLKATCAPHYFRVVRQRDKEQADRDRTLSATGSHGRQPTALSAQPGPAALHAATRGCLAGIGVCFVSHVGKIYGCGYMPIEAGDFRQKSLSEIWQHSELFAELRDLERLKGKCRRCGYVRVCGGCRARAYGSTGDHLAEEPFCVYEPGGRG
jgi:radical SAM protein with 4Fe4S-binding SPASM domain